MTSDDYLRALIRQYAVNAEGAMTAGNLIYPLLEQWSNGHLLRAEFSGSLAKGTGISLSTDADIFLSLSSSTPGTLAEMYTTLANAVRAGGYPVRMQDVSIGTTVNNYSIDLVPGRRQSQFGNEHSLYRNRTGSWTKTDVQNHISTVANSGRVEEIKLVKLWRIRHGLRFPSFYLELACLDALRYSPIGELANNTWKVLGYLRDSIETVRLYDPANTNNSVSDDCVMAEKSRIASQARDSLGKKTWAEVVW